MSQHFKYKMGVNGEWIVMEMRDGVHVAQYELEEHAALDVKLFNDRMNNLGVQGYEDRVNIFICIIQIMKERGMKV